MCVSNGPLFQRCQIYDWFPCSNKMYMNDQIFLDAYVKGPTFLTSWFMLIFFAQRFFRCCLFSWYSMKWLRYLSTSNKCVQKRYCMNRTTFRMVTYMNGSVFSKARYMNGVGFEILARTPVPQLPCPHPLPAPPTPPPTPELFWGK